MWVSCVRWRNGIRERLLVWFKNKAGSIKGEKLPFWSDVLLVMKRGANDIVEMDLQKSRRTQCPGELGKFIRIWQQGEFVSEAEIEGLRKKAFRVVEGGARPGDKEAALPL